ncbi:MAG TPA: hypothetical protein VIJ59_03755 [Caulobacteraceae bacterium]
MSALRNIVTGGALLAGAAVLATTATASATHLTDSQYIAAAHCQGLSNSRALGETDSSGINALMKSEGAYRVPEISDRADDAKTRAMSMAAHASPAVRSELVSERDGACQVWARGAGATVASGGR